MPPHISLVDPAAPATGTMFILSLDSLVSTVLYRPGGSADVPTFTFTSAHEGKHITLHHDGATGAVAGEIVLHGILKKGIGMVKLAGGRDVKAEEWGKMTKDGVAVMIHGEQYVWSKLIEKDPKNPNMTKSFYEAVSTIGTAVTYVPSWSDAHVADTVNHSYNGTKTITRAHVHFASEVDEKVIPELLLSLSLFRHLDIKNNPSHTPNVFGIQALDFTCPVQ